MSTLPRNARIYILAVVAAGAAMLALALLRIPLEASLLLQAALFAGLATLADVKRVRLYSANYSVASAINFACVIVLGVDTATWTTAVASTAGDIARRKPLYKAVFNGAAISSSVAAGGMVLTIVRAQIPAASPDRLSPSDVPAFAAYAATNLLVNFLLVGLVVALANGSSIRQTLLRMRSNCGEVFAPLAAVYPLGLLMAVVYIYFGQAFGLLLLVTPTMAAYAALEKARQLRERNEELVKSIGKNEELLEQLSTAHGDLRVTHDELTRTHRELTQTHEELKRAQAQVVQQERLRALGQMASGIAHDFNNALAPVVGFSELLLVQPERWDDGEYVRRYLELINSAARDATGVVRQLREFYRRGDEGEVLLPVDLNPLVEQTIDLTQAKWRIQAQASGTTITLVTDLEAMLPIMADEAALREVLTNLIFNAVDAMPDGGTLTIRTCSVAGRVRLEVSDTGIGMSEVVRQQCLDPFFTTKGAAGTGLGLSMVHGIVQRHQGQLEIETEWGRGTTIRATFPGCLSREAQPADRVTSPTEDGTWSRPLRVLVVDDEPGGRQVISAYLDSYGHTAETAESGHDGLRRFQEGVFDVVITDRAMPEMNGDHLALAIKQENAAVPVVMLTGFGDLLGVTGEKPAGVDLILSKPVLHADLRRALSTVKTAS